MNVCVEWFDYVQISLFFAAEAQIPTIVIVHIDGSSEDVLTRHEYTTSWPFRHVLIVNEHMDVIRCRFVSTRRWMTCLKIVGYSILFDSYHWLTAKYTAQTIAFSWQTTMASTIQTKKFCMFGLFFFSLYYAKHNWTPAKLVTEKPIAFDLYFYLYDRLQSGTI